MAKKKNSLWTVIGRIALVVGIIAPIGILIASLINLKKNNLKLEFQINGIQFLTPKTEVDDFKGIYYYKDSLIDNLWVVDIKMINTGTETIIGKGSKKNIIEEDIPMKFSNDFKIVKVEKIKSDFKHRIKTLINTSSEFSLSFNQWRKEETLIYKFYLISKNNKTVPKLENIERSLINGDILIKELNHPNLNNKKPLLDYAPSTIALIGRIGSIIVALLGIMILLKEYFRGVYHSFLLYSWKRTYLDTYKTYLIKNEQMLREKSTLYDFHILEEILNNPRTYYPDNFWEEAQIPKPFASVENSQPFNTFNDWLITTALILLGVFILIAIISAVVII